jgi:hypothetical protein
MDAVAENTKVSALNDTPWTTRTGLWSWLSQVRALPPERKWSRELVHCGSLVVGARGKTGCTRHQIWRAP